MIILVAAGLAAWRCVRFADTFGEISGLMPIRGCAACLRLLAREFPLQLFGGVDLSKISVALQGELQFAAGFGRPAALM